LITGAGHRSLYILTADEKTTSAHNKLSACYNACTAVWPPVLASKLPAVSGLAKRSLVGLITRRDGTKQVTYNGLPLYYYVADAKAGESVGNHLKDRFGLWIGMLPSGKLAPDGVN
jgi:predicted lipoprotein with Yx(FWY)xxD motif